MQIFGGEYRQAKGYRAGTHRTRPPVETLREYSRFMPAMGITRLANITGLDCIGLPVYLAIRPNARALSGAQGKGVDAESAKASALMEAIEGWHAERIERPLRYESYTEMRHAGDVVDVEGLGRRAGSVLRSSTPMLWIEGWDLLYGAPRWVPFDTVSTNFVKSPSALSPFLESTNGLASGNHLLEAVSHALCELIERDAVALWSFMSPAEQKARQIDLATVDDPECRRLLDRLEGAGVYTALWDVTSDAGIPTYSCTLLDAVSRPRWRSVGAFSGYGCHLAPALAVMRALSEAVQSRLTIISGSRDDMFPGDYVANQNDDDRARRLASFSNPAPRADYRVRRALATETFEEDIEILLASLRRIEIRQAVVVDLSREAVGIPVVKAVVPGLEAFRTSASQSGRRARALMARPRS